MFVVLLPEHGYREDKDEGHQNVRELPQPTVDCKCLVPNRERLKDQQSKETEKQDCMNLNRRGYGCVKMRKLGKVGDPKARDEDGKERKQNASDIAVRAFHRQWHPFGVESRQHTEWTA
jgi:hypothetical protein